MFPNMQTYCIPNTQQWSNKGRYHYTFTVIPAKMKDLSPSPSLKFWSLPEAHHLCWTGGMSLWHFKPMNYGCLGLWVRLELHTTTQGSTASPLLKRSQGDFTKTELAYWVAALSQLHGWRSYGSNYSWQSCTKSLSAAVQWKVLLHMRMLLFVLFFFCIFF